MYISSTSTTNYAHIDHCHEFDVNFTTYNSNQHTRETKSQISEKSIFYTEEIGPPKNLKKQSIPTILRTFGVVIKSMSINVLNLKSPTS